MGQGMMSKRPDDTPARKVFKHQRDDKADDEANGDGKEGEGDVPGKHGEQRFPETRDCR